MKLFSLSTAEQGASMALFQGETLICESYWAGSKSHSMRLMPMVEQMIVDQAGLAMSDIDGFIAAKGPGSFTGLRIGISVIKGLAFAVSKPCAGISSLDGIACRFCQALDPVCVMMDARRNEVYTAVYRFNKGILVEKSEERVCPPKQAVDQALGRAMGSSGPVLFVGSGSKVYQEMIKDHAGARLSHSAMDYVSAAALVRRAQTISDLFDDKAHYLVPTYLRLSDAQIHLSQKSVS